MARNRAADPRQNVTKVCPIHRTENPAPPARRTRGSRAGRPAAGRAGAPRTPASRSTTLRMPKATMAASNDRSGSGSRVASPCAEMHARVERRAPHLRRARSRASRRRSPRRRPRRRRAMTALPPRSPGRPCPCRRRARDRVPVRCSASNRAPAPAAIETRAQEMVERVVAPAMSSNMPAMRAGAFEVETVTRPSRGETTAARRRGC